MLQEWSRKAGATVETLLNIFRKMKWKKEETIVEEYVVSLLPVQSFEW